MRLSTPKQLEIQKREDLILRSARRVIVGEGYHGLSMDRIAADVGTSKGTIYNHFGCKEEIIIALAVQTMEKRLELFRRASEFRGSSRQRVFAIACANGFFFKKYPDYFRFEQMLRIESIWEKTSEERQQLVKACEMNCMSVVSGIVRDGIASEDLALSSRISPEDLVFGLWALSLGAQSIIASSASLPDLGVGKPNQVLVTHIQALLDSHQWKPLSTDFDFESLIPRIEQEVLSESSIAQTPNGKS